MALKLIKLNSNALGAKDCAEELYPDDGRVTFGDPKENGGKWGRNLKGKMLHLGYDDEGEDLSPKTRSSGSDKDRFSF